MTDKTPPNTEYDALAKRYLDLWQEQVGKLAQDPGQLTNTAAAWSQMAASMMKNMSQPQPASTHGSTQPSSTASTGPSSDRTASPQSAHEPGRLDLADVVSRLDALERRLAALEQSVRAGALVKPARPARAVLPTL